MEEFLLGFIDGVDYIRFQDKFILDGRYAGKLTITKKKTFFSNMSIVVEITYSDLVRNFANTYSFDYSTEPTELKDRLITAAAISRYITETSRMKLCDTCFVDEAIANKLCSRCNYRKYFPVKYEDNLCAICLESNDLTSVTVGCCNKLFHVYCVKKMLQINLEKTHIKSDVFRCPTCRSSQQLVYPQYINGKFRDYKIATYSAWCPDEADYERYEEEHDAFDTEAPTRTYAVQLEDRERFWRTELEDREPAQLNTEEERHDAFGATVDTELNTDPNHPITTPPNHNERQENPPAIVRIRRFRPFIT